MGLLGSQQPADRLEIKGLSRFQLFLGRANSELRIKISSVD